MAERMKGQTHFNSLRKERAISERQRVYLSIQKFFDAEMQGFVAGINVKSVYNVKD